MSQRCKRIHLINGIQSFGNSTTISASKFLGKEDDKIVLEMIEHGVLVTNHTPGLAHQQKVLVPFTNIKGIDFNYAQSIKGSDQPEVIVKPKEETAADRARAKLKASKVKPIDE